MKTKLLSFFLLLIILSSCAEDKYFAQEFSVQSLKQALKQVQGYNKDDGFYYQILKEGGYKLNISQQRVVQNNFDEQTIKEIGMQKQKSSILAFEKFNDKYNILTPQNLEDALFKAEPIYNNDNYALNLEIDKIKNLVQEDIISRYQITQSQIKKLKLDEIKISNIKLQVYPASCMPYVIANFDITATFGEITTEIKNYTENFLIEIQQDSDSFSYKIGYTFIFDENIDKNNFEQSLFITLNKTKPSQIKQKAYNSVDLKKLKINYQDKWLEISKYSKTIAEKYLFFVCDDCDITDRISTQDKNYLDDTFFIGDSIFEGFTFYNLAHQNNVLSKVGVGARNILELKLFSNEKEYTLEQFLLKNTPKRVYIMLGLNDVNIISENQYQENYQELVDFIQSKSPSTDIIITSMSPIRKLTFSTPERLQRYNQRAKIVAQNNQNTYYLDVFDYLSTNGILCTKYSAQDGLHFSVDTYHILLDYINIHQVRSDFTPSDIFIEQKLLDMQNEECVFDETLVKSVEKAYKEKGTSSAMKVKPPEEVTE